MVLPFHTKLGGKIVALCPTLAKSCHPLDTNLPPRRLRVKYKVFDEFYTCFGMESRIVTIFMTLAIEIHKKIILKLKVI